MMTVKPKRSYDSTRRREQAAQTRAVVLRAAREVFIAAGWNRTTIARIAEAAGVSPETIYATFGTKRALLEATLSATVRDRQPDTPLVEQEAPRAIAAATDQREQLALFATDITRVLSRAAPLALVARAAVEADPELEDLYAQIHRGRRSNIATVVDALLRNGPLRSGLDRGQALDIAVWLTSPELYSLITGVERRSPAEFTTWLRDRLMDLLLPY